MIQKEVAQRLKAKAGEKDYGALSVAASYYADAEIMLTVPPSCFMPQPKVASAVVTLRILDKPRVNTVDEGFFFHIVRCAFGQRRKTLLNCLINLGGLRLNKDELLQEFEKLQLNEKIRGEALTIEQFAALSNALYPFKK